MCQVILRSHVQDSMLTSVTYTSSSCSGSFCGEMALAVIERTVNESGELHPRSVHFQPKRTHDALLITIIIGKTSHVKLNQVRPQLSSNQILVTYLRRSTLGAGS